MCVCVCACECVCVRERDRETEIERRREKAKKRERMSFALSPFPSRTHARTPSHTPYTHTHIHTHIQRDAPIQTPSPNLIGHISGDTHILQQIPQNMLQFQNPPNRETQIPRCKSKLNQDVNLNLYREIPRIRSFSIRWISGV